MNDDAQPVLRRDAAERDRVAEAIADHLDKPLTAAGIIFALVVLAETTIAMAPTAAAVFEVIGWVLWALFVVEFLARLVIAPSTAGFLRRNWWQVIFLAVPFLRFLRPLARLRIPRVGRIFSSAVRTSRTASRRLSARVTWLAAVTVIVILSGSQLAFVLGEYESFGDALYAAAMAAVAGEPLAQRAGAIKLLDVVLALYSVVVFAGLAGALGAYFLERRGSE